MRVAFYTLGCKLNFAETSTLKRSFSAQGYEPVDFNNQADIYVINSCTVTGKADKKSKEAIKKARNQNPEARIIVIGCFAQLSPETLADIPGVDLILGNHEKYNIIQYLQKADVRKTPKIHTHSLHETNAFHPAYSLGDRTRSFLKIQDGCDYRCAYCTIPKARGESRNTGIESILEQARNIAKNKVKEIILTGVNLGDFGKSNGEPLPELLFQLEQIPGIERYRISSIEPNLLSDEIIHFISRSEKFLPHFHIPLQSGSDAMLAKMKRRYNRAFFENKIQKIKQRIPHAFIGVDVITGFPGENTRLFEETHEFIKKLDASYYHVFPYSDRPGTPSYEMHPKIMPETIKERSHRLQQVAQKKLWHFYRQHLQEEREVLLEKYNHHGNMFGFTDNYIKVVTQHSPEWAGKIKKFHLQRINEKGYMVGIPKCEEKKSHETCMQCPSQQGNE